MQKPSRISLMVCTECLMPIHQIVSAGSRNLWTNQNIELCVCRQTALFYFSLMLASRYVIVVKNNNYVYFGDFKVFSNMLTLCCNGILTMHQKPVNLITDLY